MLTWMGEHGADLNILNAAGDNVMHVALQNEDTPAEKELLKTLLVFGVDFSKPSGSGLLPEKLAEDNEEALEELESVGKLANWLTDNVTAFAPPPPF